MEGHRGRRCIGVSCKMQYYTSRNRYVPKRRALFLEKGDLQLPNIGQGVLG